MLETKQKERHELVSTEKRSRPKGVKKEEKDALNFSSIQFYEEVVAGATE